MDKAKQVRVQGLTFEGRHTVRHFVAQLFSRALTAAPIEGVADEGMAKFGEVNPDLVSAAGLQLTFDEGRKGLCWRPKTFQGFVACAGVFAAGFNDGHFLAI